MGFKNISNLKAEKHEEEHPYAEPIEVNLVDENEGWMIKGK